MTTSSCTMSGPTKETPEQKRSRLLGEREARVVELLEKGVPMTNIAIIEGVEVNCMWRECRKIIKKHGIVYEPKTGAKTEAPPGMTGDSAQMRSSLGTLIYKMSAIMIMSEIEIAKATGLPARCQGRAKNGSFHDWTISQMERLAASTGQGFKELLIRSLLSTEDLPDIINLLVPPRGRRTETQQESVKCSRDLLNTLS